MSKDKNKITILAKPMNMLFEIVPNKIADFFTTSKNNAFDKAIERSDKHKGTNEKNNIN